MKTKLKKQARKPNLNATPEPPVETPTQQAATTNGPVVRTLEFPPPEYLLEEAMGEPNRRLLQDYSQTIHVLRDEKGFTFREIAEWLTEYGVEADHNAVYRAYTKGMTEAEAAEIAQHEEEEDQGS